MSVPLLVLKSSTPSFQPNKVAQTVPNTLSCSHSFLLWFLLHWTPGSVRGSMACTMTPCPHPLPIWCYIDLPEFRPSSTPDFSLVHASGPPVPATMESGPVTMAWPSPCSVRLPVSQASLPHPDPAAASHSPIVMPFVFRFINMSLIFPIVFSFRS